MSIIISIIYIYIYMLTFLSFSQWIWSCCKKLKKTNPTPTQCYLIWHSCILYFLWAMNNERRIRKFILHESSVILRPFKNLVKYRLFLSIPQCLVIPNFCISFLAITYNIFRLYYELLINFNTPYFANDPYLLYATMGILLSHMLSHPF